VTRTAAIDVTALTKAFSGKEVVKSLSLTVGSGEIFGFLGPNGSGKTTFLRMLCGLLRPDGGHGLCLGYDIVHESVRIRPQVGYMAQRFSLYEDMSVRENLEFMARIYDVGDRRQRLDEIVARLRLEPYLEQLAGRLSGGWKQRLALGCCLIHRPKLLLLDEPTAGVDPAARREFWDEIHRLSAEGVTALVSTHYMDEAERCHRLAYLAYGNLLAVGTAREIIASAGLATWRVSAPSAEALLSQLQPLTDIAEVVSFGDTLRISTKDGKGVETFLRGVLPTACSVQQVPSSLEEVFVHLMRKAGEG
jgi:ABC-2 type transport system ATP-binding protein